MRSSRLREHNRYLLEQVRGSSWTRGGSARHGGGGGAGWFGLGWLFGGSGSGSTSRVGGRSETELNHDNDNANAQFTAYGYEGESQSDSSASASAIEPDQERERRRLYRAERERDSSWSSFLFSLCKSMLILTCVGCMLFAGATVVNFLFFGVQGESLGDAMPSIVDFDAIGSQINMNLSPSARRRGQAQAVGVEMRHMAKQVGRYYHTVKSTVASEMSGMLGIDVAHPSGKGSGGKKSKDTEEEYNRNDE